MSLFGPLGRSLHPYVGALVRSGQATDVAALIEELAPHWDSNMGYARLGKAALDAGLYDGAEAFFVKLREAYPDAYRGAEMGMLAGIWLRKGRTEEAWTLLTESL